MPSSKIFPNIISLNAAIASCEKGHQWLLALHFLQCSRWTSMRPDVISYSSVLSACATQGQWRWALEVYGRMKGETLEMWLDVISCNAAGPRTGFFGDAAGHPNKSGEVLMSVRNMFLKTGF
jgi:pentatricopeptide repeat domain-containing protein 1